MQERIVTVRRARLGPEEAALDRAFWKAVPPERRLHALWDLVKECRSLKGEEPLEPRLQRSVLRIQRP